MQQLFWLFTITNKSLKMNIVFTVRLLAEIVCIWPGKKKKKDKTWCKGETSCQSSTLHKLCFKKRKCTNKARSPLCSVESAPAWQALGAVGSKVARHDGKCRRGDRKGRSGSPLPVDLSGPGCRGYSGPLNWFPERCCLMDIFDPAASPSFLHTTLHISLTMAFSFSLRSSS